MKKILLITTISVYSIISAFAQPSIAFEQGDVGPVVSENPSNDLLENNVPNEIESTTSNLWLSGNNLLAVAGVFIALIFGVAQWASSYNMYKATKSNARISKYLNLLQDFSREIYVLREERVCLIKALKSEGADNQIEDSAFLVDDSILRNLRDAAIQKLNMPRKTIKQTTLDEYMNLPAIPTIKAVDFKYKKG